MSKQILSEEFLRMQKLAGLITEGEYKEHIKELEENENAEEAAFDIEFKKASNDIASALKKELEQKNNKELNEGIVLGTIATIMTGNAIIGLVSKYSAKLFKLLNFKKGEDIAEKIYHWAHENEESFQSPIKRVLGFFIKDPKTLDILTKGIYAVIVGSMAAGYGVNAINKLSNAEWFSSSLNALKTLAKADETIVNSYPAVKALIN
jgi:hypothetical protein